MEVIANSHSKRYPIELSYRETANKTVSFVFSLENAKKLLSDLDIAIKEIEEQNDKRRKKEALQTSIPELRPKFKVGDIIAHNFRKRYPIWYEPNCFIVSVDEKGYNLKDGGFIGFGVQDDYFLVGRFNPNPTDSDAVPVRFEEEDGEKYPFVNYKDHLEKPWEWSEEEKEVLDSIIDDYEKAAKSFCGYDGKIGLLRAIRDGEYDLSKQEWSEEDEEKLNLVIDYLRFPGPLMKYKLKDWLKSLPERFNSKKCNKEMDLDTKLQDRLEEISRNGLENPHTIDFSKEYENSKKILEKGSSSTGWSEEDEKMRQSIIKDIEFERNFTSATTGRVSEKYNEQINWLKLLSLNRKKMNEDVAKLCSNEWSEEDERLLTKLMTFVDIECFDRECNGEDLIDWLKSFRPVKQNVNNMITPNKKFFQWIYDRLVNVHKENPNVDYMRSFKERIDNSVFDQCHWKPSEEQKEALEYVIRDYREDGCNPTANYLQEILDHLKNM